MFHSTNLMSTSGYIAKCIYNCANLRFTHLWKQWKAYRSGRCPFRVREAPGSMPKGLIRALQMHRNRIVNRRLNSSVEQGGADDVAIVDPADEQMVNRLARR